MCSSMLFSDMEVAIDTWSSAKSSTTANKSCSSMVSVIERDRWSSLMEVAMEGTSSLDDRFTQLWRKYGSAPVREAERGNNKDAVPWRSHRVCWRRSNREERMSLLLITISSLLLFIDAQHKSIWISKAPVVWKPHLRGSTFPPPPLLPGRAGRNCRFTAQAPENELVRMITELALSPIPRYPNWAVHNREL